MLGSKYRAFYSLYAHPGSACDNLYEFTSLSTGAVYQIAVSTTLLGRKFTPNWKWMHEDKIVSAASTLITRHQDIARTNIIKVIYSTLIKKSNINFHFQFCYVFSIADIFSFAGYPIGWFQSLWKLFVNIGQFI